MPRQGKRWAFGTKTISICKSSSERYDPDETWFRGFELVEGTVVGAMKAGMRVYQ